MTFTDSDWAKDSIDRKSVTGVYTELNGSPLDWQCMKQPRSPALSTAEAEYVAAFEGAKSLVSWKNMIEGLGAQELALPLEINIDNAAAIKQSEQSSKKQRHIDLRYHFVRHMYEQGTVKAKKVASADNIADMFTKVLPQDALERLRERIMI